MIAVFLASLATVAPSTDQEIVDQIALSCGLAAGDLTITEGKRVRIRPKVTPTYEAATCVVSKLNEAGFMTKIGFISEPPVQKKK